MEALPPVHPPDVPGIDKPPIWQWSLLSIRQGGSISENDTQMYFSWFPVSNPESSFSISALIRPSKVTHPPPLICHRFDVLAHSIVASCSHCVSTGAWNKLPALEEADEVKIWRFVILCENSVRSTGSIKFAIEALFGLEVPVQLITVFNGLVEPPYFALFLRL